MSRMDALRDVSRYMMFGIDYLNLARAYVGADVGRIAKIDELWQLAVTIKSEENTPILTSTARRDVNHLRGECLRSDVPKVMEAGDSFAIAEKIIEEYLIKQANEG